MSKKITIEKLEAKHSSNDRVSGWLAEFVSDAALEDFMHCGDYLVMAEDEPRENRKLLNGYFCRQRLCSGCAWRRSVKAAQCLSAISARLAEEGRVMLMITLTVPNVPGLELRDTIQHIGRSWNRLMRRKRYACWADNVRKLEVTYNRERYDYHPHLHALVYVRPSYFKKQYISQAQLLEDWRSVTKQPEITQVDLRRCRDQNDSNGIVEVAKYTVKASDYNQSQEVFNTMYKALKHTRLMTFGGRCKELRDAYKRGDLSEYDQTEETKYVYRVVYMWQRLTDGNGVYVEDSVEPYDEDADKLQKAQEREERREMKLMQEAHERAQREKDWSRFQALRTWANTTDWDGTLLDF